MFAWLNKKTTKIDWLTAGAVLPLLVFGLVTMNSFTDQSYFFFRQMTWVFLALAAFFTCSLIDWRFARKSGFLVAFYLFLVGLLAILFILGTVTKGAQSWLSFGGFSLQPADFMKLALVLMLAKYFSKRHIEIANFRHIIISGLYALVPFVAIMLQPDFGSALIIFAIWLGMILVSGVSKKHLLILALISIVASLGAWTFLLKPYQKDRIASFIHPLADIQGSGYNAFQSTIAVGSGQIFGKGVGFGTQSRLKFLPEYQTDFIFAAFTEEWGLVQLFCFSSLA